MLRRLLFTALPALLFPLAAEAQTHGLTASATVLAPVRPDPAAGMTLAAGGSVLELAGGKDTRHVVTVSAAAVSGESGAAEGRVLVRGTDGGARLVPARHGAATRGSEVLRGDLRGGTERLDLEALAKAGSTRLQVTYRIAADV